MHPDEMVCVKTQMLVHLDHFSRRFVRSNRREMFARYSRSLARSGLLLSILHLSSPVETSLVVLD